MYSTRRAGVNSPPHWWDAVGDFVPSDTHEHAMRRYIGFLESLRTPFLTSFEITRNLNSNHGPEAEPVEVLTGGAPMLHSVRLANPNPGGCHHHCRIPVYCVWNFRTWVFNTDASIHPNPTAGLEALYELEAQALPEFKFSTLRSLVWVTEGYLGQTRRDFPAAQIPHPVRGLFKAFSSIERLVYGGPYANELPRFLKEADVAGDKCWRQLRVIALQCLAPPAASVVPEHTDDEAHELMARRRAVGAPIEVTFVSSSLAWPWTMFDTEFLDV
ncbi:hypothetical protein FIBSPDRAFT_956090 [Athelia psychrophila]|uniref:Uncharacterized protein n=1 Tax=Athelia psychrophila TaxID=1759441 RepID=A0A166HCN7_9AGAM|nr:hypothetical protein FIBSPDRAFT_956090 [Fibularhizoctonia sp. CBS 109695]